MNHSEGTFKGARQMNIYYQAWLPDDEAKAVLLIVHGLGEHSSRYVNVVNYFVPRGFAVYAMDHIGHGKSEGAREYVERFEDFTETLEIFCQMVKGWQAGKPIFLLGHSIGGLIAADYLLNHQADFRGAIFSGAAISAGKSVSPITMALSKILSTLAPKMGVLRLDASLLSRDPQVVSAYVNDPLVFHGKTPARLGAELLKAIQRVSAEMEKISLPFIIVQGSEDKLVDPAGAQALYQRASSKDKTIKVYQGLYHEVFNEPERDMALKDIEDWLTTHV